MWCNPAVSTHLVGPPTTAGSERQRERRAGAERLVLDRLEAGVRAGAYSDPSKGRGIDNTASPLEAAAVDQRRNACRSASARSRACARTGKSSSHDRVRAAFAQDDLRN